LKNNHIRVGDFGTAKNTSVNPAITNDISTAYYMAPEFIKLCYENSNKKLSFKADIWFLIKLILNNIHFYKIFKIFKKKKSFGLIIYELITLKRLYILQDDDDNYYRIISDVKIPDLSKETEEEILKNLLKMYY
jgi:serine/threonine protein kinase